MIDKSFLAEIVYRWMMTAAMLVFSERDMRAWIMTIWRIFFGLMAWYYATFLLSRLGWVIRENVY